MSLREKNGVGIEICILREDNADHLIRLFPEIV